MDVPTEGQSTSARSSVAEVFLVFLRWGLTSFGGPVAHLGYFREEFVARRKWLDEHAYADLVALCRFLPGPVCRLWRGTGCARATVHLRCLSRRAHWRLAR